MIRLFAFDLDGTSLDSNSRLTKENIEAFRKLDESGIKFVLASGRSAESVLYMLEKIGIDNPYVATNGAISYISKNNILKANYFDLNILRELIEFARSNNYYYHFYDPENFYAEVFDQEKLAHLLKDGSNNEYQVSLNFSKDTLSSLEKNGLKPLKIQIFVENSSKKTRDEVMDLLRLKYKERLYITKSFDNVIEIMDIKSNKWNSILDISDKLGIKKEEIASIGDEDNDIEMVLNAKYGFAVANAIDSLKEVADFIVADNDNGGILEAVEKVLEINRNV